jgi:hypothetical protein
MTNIISWFHKEVGIMNVAETKDPVPMLLDKLSSGDQIKIKIQNNNDNIFIQHNKKVQSIHISEDLRKEHFQMPKTDRWFSLLSNSRSPNFPTLEQKHLLSKLKFIPVYTVVNNNNEIVTASPRESKTFYSLKWVQEKFNELFFWTHDEGSISMHLFFMNKEDAASYLHEICKKEPKEAEYLGLKLKRVGLDVFYKLNRTSPPKIQSRLVADLKEVDSLLTTHLNSSFYTVHPKQKYSKSWFQGNPIYALTLQKDLVHKNLTEYFFKPTEEKKVIFFSREDAIKAWRNFLLRERTLKLPDNPNIEIYNLESLLSDMENITEKSIDVVFVPPYNAYLELKQTPTEVLSPLYNPVQESLFRIKLCLKDVERFYRGLVWLFTSDTLPSEENSW